MFSILRNRFPENELIGRYVDSVIGVLRPAHLALAVEETFFFELLIKHPTTRALFLLLERVLGKLSITDSVLRTVERIMVGRECLMVGGTPFITGWS